MERERRSRDYWREQLSEYWDGGLTIQEYCELKDLPYESVRRWIGILKKERAGKSPASGELEFVEVPLPAGGARNGSDSGISLHAARSKDSGAEDWLMILDYSGVRPVRKSSACFKGTSIL